MPHMDETTRNMIIEYVESIGRDRATVQPDMRDADFLAGALTVMFALGMKLDRTPASWVLGLMLCNQSPLRALNTKEHLV